MKALRQLTLLLVLILGQSLAHAQSDRYQSVTLPTTYESVEVRPIGGKEVRNVVLMIGDGMSLSHIATLWTANGGRINLSNAQATGLVITTARDQLITDSAAAATAMSTGRKANYHTLAVDTLGHPLVTIVDIANRAGLGTGVVSTCRLYDATPAAFLAHNKDRDALYEIIAQFPESNCDLIMGGGAHAFEKRPDGRDIFMEMEQAGYRVTRSLEEFAALGDDATEKSLCVYAEKDVPEPLERGDLLPDAAVLALNHLQKHSPEGFFLMIEGSQLDDYGHTNDLDLLMQETADFDRTVGEVMKWAEQDGETLVIVLADHETGGLTLVGGDLERGEVQGHFSTGSHSGTIVPAYLYGPAAEYFTGIYHNTEIYRKIMRLLGLSEHCSN
ncbi:MAG: alkaline phosphatase [Porphyromonas sp.]|nr:alkaline phosphatase [Porphyromonas sp.]